MPNNHPIEPTGITELDLSYRTNGVHVLGTLHKRPLAIARLSGTITRYSPDVVAVEARGRAIRQFHPDNHDARWPPRNEVEAAAYAVQRDYDGFLAGIGEGGYTSSVDFARLDREIFREMGILDEDDRPDLWSYYGLDLADIREWRARTQARAPEAYRSVIGAKDERMAGRLQALIEHDEIETIVAAIGMQHLPGVLDLLAEPGAIPADAIDWPPVVDYRILPRDHPHSTAV